LENGVWENLGNLQVTRFRRNRWVNCIHYHCVREVRTLGICRVIRELARQHHVILLISANVPRRTSGKFELELKPSLSYALLPSRLHVSANLLACSQTLRLATSISVGTSLRRHLGGRLHWRTQAHGGGGYARCTSRAQDPRMSLVSAPLISTLPALIPPVSPLEL